MNTIYRIYTENKNKTEIENLIARTFTAFTVFLATGHWQGMPERSLVVEIAAHEKDYTTVAVLADEIRTLNDQDAVLIQSMPTTIKLIDADFKKQTKTEEN